MVRDEDEVAEEAHCEQHLSPKSCSTDRSATFLLDSDSEWLEVHTAHESKRAPNRSCRRRPGRGGDAGAKRFSDQGNAPPSGDLPSNPAQGRMSRCQKG